MKIKSNKVELECNGYNIFGFKFSTHNQIKNSKVTIYLEITDKELKG